MQEILEQVKTLKETDELFLMWEQELDLRHTMRKRSVSSLSLSGDEDLDFLFRSFFWTQKYDFFELLFKHLHLSPVLNWLSKAPGWLAREFLAFLPWYIDSIETTPRQLQFLIALYRDEFYDDFLHLVNILNLESCDYLLPKTANPALRTLLKSRKNNLQAMIVSKRYGELGQNKTMESHGMFGDKMILLRQAVILLDKISPSHFHDPYNARRFELLLGTAEIIFRAGLIEDCLAFLLDSFEDYREKNRLVDLIEDIKIYKHFQRILRSVIPLYCLLYYPWEAAAKTRYIYQCDFERLIPDNASLCYLDMFAVTLSYSGKSATQTVNELSLISQSINRFRPSEPLLLTTEEANRGLSQKRLAELSSLYHQKLVSIPHEAYIIMETIRVLNLLKLAPLDAETAGELLASYLQFWKWIPSSLFINEGILKQLGPLVDDASRQEARRILDMIQVYSGDKLQEELSKRPELFRKKNEEIRRNIVQAKYMGVKS